MLLTEMEKLYTKLKKRPEAHHYCGAPEQFAGNLGFGCDPMHFTYRSCFTGDNTGVVGPPATALLCTMTD